LEFSEPDEVFTIYNTYLELWELDPLDSDEYVDTLDYSVVNVPLDYTGGGIVEGWGPSNLDYGEYDRAKGKIELNVKGLAYPYECE
jgi:hypothetical protein